MDLKRAFTVVMILFILLLLACSEPEWREPFTERLQITIRDSISVQEDDSCCAPAVLLDADFSGSGTVLTLTECEWCLSEYGSEGDFIRNLSHQGYNTGEIGFPEEIAVMPDGRILVWDVSMLLITVLSDDGEPIQSVAGWSLLPPVEICGLEGDLYSGVEFAYDLPGDEKVVVIIKPSVFTTGDAEATSVLFFDTLSFRPSEQVSSSPEGLIGMVNSVSDGHDRIFYSRDSSSSYKVLCWNTRGELLFTAALNIPPVEKTQQEILDEEEYIARRLGFAAPGYQLDPFHNIVDGIGVDPSGNLWVQRGTEDHPVFDVFDESGEHAATAEFDRPGRFWHFRITPFGALAWNSDPPDGVQKVYTLELPGVN